jgi:hypothetical protein
MLTDSELIKWVRIDVLPYRASREEAGTEYCVSEIVQKLEAARVDVDALRRHSGGPGPYTGELLFALQTFSPVVGTVLGAWLGSRKDRKVRVKVGDVYAEASTALELERVLSQVNKIRKFASKYSARSVKKAASKLSGKATK